MLRITCLEHPTGSDTRGGKRIRWSDSWENHQEKKPLLKSHFEKKKRGKETRKRQRTEYRPEVDYQSSKAKINWKKNHFEEMNLVFSVYGIMFRDSIEKKKCGYTSVFLGLLHCWIVWIVWIVLYSQTLCLTLLDFENSYLTPEFPCECWKCGSSQEEHALRW